MYTCWVSDIVISESRNRVFDVLTGLAGDSYILYKNEYIESLEQLNRRCRHIYGRYQNVFYQSLNHCLLLLQF